MFDGLLFFTALMLYSGDIYAETSPLAVRRVSLGEKMKKIERWILDRGHYFASTDIYTLSLCILINLNLINRNTQFIFIYT